MRELLLLRHAKSSWEASGLDDHDRDLNARGISAARRIGRLLGEAGLIPDRVICSTAIRALRTLELVTEALNRSLEVERRHDLYLAAPDTILDLIRRQPDECGRLLVIGHNPGFERLARLLARDGDPAALQALRERYPTGALAHFVVQGGWIDLATGPAHLQGFHAPRNLPD